MDRWPSPLPQELIDAVTDNIQDDPTTLKTFFTSSDFLFFLAGCIGLKELTLFNVAADESDHPTTETEPNAQRVQLESLIIDETDGKMVDLLLSPQSPVDLRHFRSLSSYGCLELPHLKELLQRPSGTLQHLSIRDLVDMGMRFTPLASHASHRHITSMEFESITMQLENLRSLYIALHNLPNWAQLLESFTIELSREHFSQRVPPAEWTALAYALMRPQMKHLSAVSVKVHPRYPHDDGKLEHAWTKTTEVFFGMRVAGVRSAMLALSLSRRPKVKMIPECTKTTRWTTTSPQDEVPLRR
ncbi:hypothetical protein DFH09DRAFT_1067222 [Mycena vulgaris]|nr:hypothetical protein DFH09DRAFT_1067222 [Mycena vulgaris]